MIILSSPSGAGKTTLVKLISKNKKYYTSISHTTRTPRLNEIDGIDYIFTDKNQFQNLVNKNEFLEYAKVFENYYGTPKKNIIDQNSRKVSDVISIVKMDNEKWNILK